MRFKSWAAMIVLVAVVWGFFSWPLPLFFDRGIASSGRNTEEPAWRAMIPGDHLQLLYHFWLASDMLAGKTPAFYNLYEFNSGNDSERYQFSTYYAPFCLVFALGKWVAGQAFGWNLTGLLSLLITYGVTLVLVRRYVRTAWVAAAASLVSVTLPYRWMVLLGGSPAGLGMMWVPVVFLGLDLMIGDRRMAGGVMAGLALILSEWVDTHVFFFCVVFTPVWCLVAYARHRRTWMPTSRDLLDYAGACAPFILLAGVMAWQVMGIQQGLETAATADTGRSLQEVAIYSPDLRGLFAWRDLGPSSDIYVGWIPVLLLLAGSGQAIYYGWKGGRSSAVLHRGVTLLLLVLAVAGIMLLAGGTNNPGGARAWSRLTRLVPPYGMIRQPSRIFTVLPVILSVGTGMALQQLLSRWPQRRVVCMACVLFAGWMCVAYGRRVHATVCVLDREQGAYQAVARDARQSGHIPRAMALPLWPGDSHWSSLYEYYSTLYRVRMVNGYRPTVRLPYLNNVYLPCEVFNKGGYPAQRLDQLLGQGIHYLILHENAFPEKVSPFAVSHTLQALLSHPRLKPLDHDRGVWAFRILETATEHAHWKPNWTLRCPARLWQAEHGVDEQAAVRRSDAAGAGAYAVMTGAVSRIRTPPYPMYYFPAMHYLVRMRGQGRVNARIVPGENRAQNEYLDVAGADWNWQKLEVDPFVDYAGLPVEFEMMHGHADLDVVMMMGADWPVTNRVIRIPAPVFFHAGYTDPDTGEVVLRPERDPADAIFYGPKVPMPAGTYEIELVYRTDAPAGTELGCLIGRYGEANTTPVPVQAGTAARMVYQQPHNLRMAFNFVYNRAAPVRIREVVIRRRQ